jgi:phosphoribosylaminoimidazolecarboxamide formyltransferase/IMP cyclohydrolase
MSYALLSVSNKEGIVEFARSLVGFGYTLISSGGTHKVISEADIPVMKVSEYTGSPEILGGRVKTLHPKIHGGILARRGDPNHDIDREANGIGLIDVVAVNLYPFKETIAKPDVTWDQAIENIDIGGPTMVRSAAKNHAHVSILTNPTQYEEFVVALDQGKVAELRSQLAVAAFQHTAQYDAAISTWMYTQTSQTP